MLTTIISSIKDKCLGIPNIQEVYEYPLQANPKKYPSIIFFLDNGDNAFETTEDNMKVFNFKMWVVFSVAGTTVQKIYSEVLPKTYDDVLAHFDENWNFGTIDGHRVWGVINTSLVGLSVEENGKTASIEMNLRVKLLSSD